MIWASKIYGLIIINHCNIDIDFFSALLVYYEFVYGHICRRSRIFKCSFSNWILWFLLVMNIYSKWLTSINFFFIFFSCSLFSIKCRQRFAIIFDIRFAIILYRSVARSFVLSSWGLPESWKSIHSLSEFLNYWSYKQKCSCVFFSWWQFERWPIY